LAPGEDPDLGDILGGVGTTDLHFEFSVDEPNEPVDIEVPQDSVPFEG
jgi:hypothetical protein